MKVANGVADFKMKINHHLKNRIQQLMLRAVQIS